MPGALLVLVALIVGLVLGIFGAGVDPRVIDTADAIGTMWLNALRMTIVPLIVALLVTGVATAARAARAGRLTGRALLWFIALLWAASAMAALVTPALLALWPLDQSAGATLANAIGGTEPVGEIPGIGDFLRALIPVNVIAAAAEEAVLPLIIFTMVFAFAVTRLPEEPRERLTGFFEALAEAMVVIVGWVLKFAPVGVFMLAFVVGASAGASAFGALAHYVVIVSAVGVVVIALAYPIAMFGGRIGLLSFARAAAPAQAVAASTRSSLASLPAMLQGTEKLGIPDARAGVVLPLAVAIFRSTGPPMNLAVAIYIAHWLGVTLEPWQIVAGVAVAAITTMGAVGLPGETSFITSIAPIGIAMGLPIEPLALLIAVEAIPDIIRTIGNVTMDVAVTTAVTGGDEPAAVSAGPAP